MAMKRFRKAASAGLLTALVATTLVACSPAGNSSVSTESATTREASAYRASRLCVLNDTDTTIVSVGEFDMKRVGESHPDPTGPLEPGATWCTNGYNSFQLPPQSPSDANVEIRFTNNYGDFMQFLVSNWSLASPIMQYGRDMLNDKFQPGPEAWEKDVTLPKASPVNQEDGPTHDYHLRRLDDTTYFIEWLITVRR
jgi:hypothetical protein